MPKRKRDLTNYELLFRAAELLAERETVQSHDKKLQTPGCSGRAKELDTMFYCCLCSSEVDTELGAVLKNCSHSFCRECIYGYVTGFEENITIACPYRSTENGNCTAVVNLKDETEIRRFGGKYLKCGATAIRSTTTAKIYIRSSEYKKVDTNEAPAEAIEISDDSEEENCFKTLNRLYQDGGLVTNSQSFQCPICFLDTDVGQGVVLRNCLHTFCRMCLYGCFTNSEDCEIKCPYADETVRCDQEVLEKEIKLILTPEDYAKRLELSLRQAESAETQSFHCKTLDCKGWCVYDAGVNQFLCPCCKKNNCLRCEAIHEGMDCKQYQDQLIIMAETDPEAKKSIRFLENLLKTGKAMRCPQCRVILQKDYGCDYLKCSCCRLDLCWATRGPRWGPKGFGDLSGGCRCRVGAQRCHPKCRNCH